MHRIIIDPAADLLVQLEPAARALKLGEVVAFPTETVYGLGADALNASALAKIFEAKQRPHTSPLIAHVASWPMVHTMAGSWPAHAQRLAQAFWPGPLTLIVPRSGHPCPMCSRLGWPMWRCVGLRTLWRRGLFLWWVVLWLRPARTDTCTRPPPKPTTSCVSARSDRLGGQRGPYPGRHRVDDRARGV